MSRINLDLEPVPPYRLDLTVWALRRRPHNIVDRWDGDTYRRVLVSEAGVPFEVEVRQTGEPAAPHLLVSAQPPNTDEPTKRLIVSSLERLLGIKCDLAGFYRLAEQDENLKPVMEKFYGFKPSRLLSNFEVLVNAIACQQLTLTMGIHLMNSLAETYGLAQQTPEGLFHAFPRPQELANANHDDLRRMKFSYQKARYITEIAQAIVSGDLDLEAVDSLDDQSAVAYLCKLKGVGRWTAEYFLLRALGRTNIFPADDVGARNHLQRWLGLTDKLNFNTVHQTIEPWRGYGGLVYFHLLLKGLAEKELLG